LRRAAALVAVLLLTAIVWISWPRAKPNGVGPARTTDRPRSPDVYAASPYQNARPGVAYVGDAACVRCHREISEAYRSHPMGRSLTPVADAEAKEPVGAGARVSFEAQGVRYTVERRGGRIFHKATRRGTDGATLGEVEAEVRYALGSGTRGIAYLIERDGFVFQSPIAYFAQERRWDISPGYGEFTTQPNFERPIRPDCLFCHVNQFRSVPGTLNRYEPPVFQGHAIGCERCHGPGELHVKSAGLSAGPDWTIVNPADLTPALRDSVCQQCHLTGSYRFTRGGRAPLDFRPGLPFYRFWAVFLTRKEIQGRFEAVGHVEQMELSRCYRASRGELGCISCHDAHSLPPPATKADYYRGRCLECHAQKGCAVSVAERRARGPGEDCIACHMPRSGITNIPHTVATDHRIPRGVPGAVLQGPELAAGQPRDVPLMDYHFGVMTALERRDAERDLGVALAWGARLMKSSPQLARAAATQGLPWLEAAVRDHPDDLAARESLGHALRILGRREEALRAFEGVLAIVPAHEWILRTIGLVQGNIGRTDLARTALQEAIAVDPWRSEYRLNLAQICFQDRDWSAAAAACRDAMRINPELLPARALLVRSYLRSQQIEKADAEFQTMLGFYPASREAWQEWYKSEKQAASAGASPSTDGAP
jgi:hypothetical protein